MFCLETACILMEASYQAYFPLPTPFNPRWNVNDVSDTKAPPLACNITDGHIRDIDKDKDGDEDAVEDIVVNKVKGIEVGASLCQSPVSPSGHIASQLESMQQY